MVNKMKFLRTSIKFNKRKLKFLLFILFLGILMGFFLNLKVDSSEFIKQIQDINVSLQNNHVNFIMIHILVLLFLVSTSFSMVGIVLFFFYFIFEVACISYSSFIFMHVFGFTGLIFGILYNVVTKLFFLICLFAIFNKVYFLVKNKFFNKEDSHEQVMQISFKKKYLEIAICCIGIILYDIFLYFGGSGILLKLTNIL